MLLREYKKALGVIPWLDHGIQEKQLKILKFSILNWIPLQAQLETTQQCHTGMTSMPKNLIQSKKSF